MQFEMLDTSLVEMAIQLGIDLDKQFGIQRSHRTLSQRDVPGQKIKCHFKVASSSVVKV